MSSFAPNESELPIFSINTNVDGGGEGAWYNGDSDGFLKNFFSGTLYFGYREGATGLFSFVPNNSQASAPLSTATIDEQLSRLWYRNQMGGNLVFQSHLARKAAPYTAVAPAAYSAAEDAKVWSASKPATARALIRKMADYYHNATGKRGIRVWLGPNEGDINTDDVCRVADPTARTSTSIARLIQLDKARWEELRGPSAPFRHRGVLCTTTSSTQALRADASSDYRVLAYATYNNGEFLKYSDAWATTCHHRSSVFEDGTSGFYGAAPPVGTGSFYYLWKAIKAGQAAYGAGAPLIPIIANEYGTGLKAGGYAGTPAGDWLTDDLTLNGKNLLRSYRWGLAVNTIFYWGIAHATFYSLAFSNAEWGTGATELEKTRGANGTQNLYYMVGASGLGAHQPLASIFPRVTDVRRYILPVGGVIDIPTKTWQITSDLDNGFHVPYTWAVCAKAYTAPTGTSINTPPWAEWAAVTFPGGDEIVSAAQSGVKKIITRPLFLPRHTSWTIRADVKCTGGGVAQIGARGFDLLNGEALVKSQAASDTYGTLSVTFRPRGHNLPMPNAARAVITLFHNGVGEARWKNVMIFPTGTPQDPGGDVLSVAVSADQNTGTSPLTVQFSAVVSGGAAPYSYQWDFGDGSAQSTEQNPSHVYNTSGSYTATCVVTDATTATSTAATTVTVTTAGATLVASASCNPSSGDAPLTVAFTGDATGGTAPYSYAWTFGDGGNSAQQNPSHTYNAVKTNTATLTVTDSVGGQDTATLSIMVTQASGGTCMSSTTNLFLNPCSASTATKRPIGTGAVYAGNSHKYTVSWLMNNAGGKFSINTPPGGYGWGMWDASNPSNSSLKTITYNGNPNNTTAKNQFPVTVRIPNGFNTSDNGPNSTEQSALIWDGEFWHDFYQLKTVSPGVYTGGSHYKQAGTGQGHGGNPRSTSSSGLWLEVLNLRGNEWNDPAKGKCEHMLGILLDRKTTNDVGPQIGPTIVWPATSGDDGYANNTGTIPYGQIFAIPPPEKGGPDPATLSLGAADSMKSRVYWHGRERGVVVIDSGPHPLYRCDQVTTSATISAMVTAMRSLYQHFRAILNVGTGGSDPIGGGSPLAPNCAFNRSSGVVIKPASFWEGKYSLAGDLSFFTPYMTGADSGKYYTLGLAVDGNRAMYDATGKTVYLDRALLYAERMMNDAAPSSSFPESSWKDSYLGWVTKSINKRDGKYEDEIPLHEVYAFRYVCLLMESMQGLSGSYGSRRDALQAFTEQNIWKKWYSRGVNSYLYREVIHISCHAAIIAQYLRKYSTNSTIASQAATVQANIDHAGISAYSGGNIRDQLVPHPVDSSMYFWRGYWNQLNRSEPYGADTNHASGAIPYFIYALENNYDVWSQTDMTKLIRLFNYIWPAPGTNYYYLDHRSNTTTNDGNNSDGLIKLGRFDRTLQKKLEGYAVAPGAQTYGNLALNAKILGG